VPTQRYIVHVDMDAFFAAIEQRDNPSYRAKPVIVGADPKRGRGRGVVSTCSYEARKFGIHSAMPISTAYRKCPHAIFLPPDFEKYSRVSEDVYKILYEFSPLVEAVGIDEAFLDITASYHLFGTPSNTCIKLKERIKKGTGLTASVGLAPTKMAAKIASDLKKPDGFVEVTQQELLKFLWPLDITKLWGVGKKTAAALRSAGINTIGDIAHKSRNELIDMFGKSAEHLWELANGIDEREVQPEPEEAKSISNEHTFEIDTDNERKIKSTLMLLCEKVSRRLREDDFKGRTITLKIRLAGFETHTISKTIPQPTNFVDSIFKIIKQLYEDFPRKGKKVRLVGVKVSNLSVSEEQLTLFKEKIDTKLEKIHKAVERINDKFGEGTVHRAGGLRTRPRKKS